MHEVATFLEIISSFSSTLALDEILARVTEKTAQVVGADSCAISLWDRISDTVIVLADYISPEVVIPDDDINDIGLPYPLANYPATARVLHEQVPFIIDVDHFTTDEAEQNLLKIFQWASLLMLPLLYKGQATGLMELYVDHGRPFRFTEDKVALCQALASQAAIAIENARLFAELETQRETLRYISARLVNAQEEERRRLSRELHDEFGQALTALKINLDVARRILPANAPPKLRHNLDEANRLTTQTQERARSLSLALHPPILDDLGLVSALRWELDCYEQRTDQTIFFEADLGDLVLSPQLEITVYRIVSEALTNVARHALARHVRVCLKVDGQHLEASVEDDGVGFDAAAWFNSPVERRSLGLISMRERAQLLGGQFQVTSKIGQGTKVWVRFPL
ncbi:MAG: GAF domain-containing sensor histidine kinase [Chloroflexi bacterium]|nr:GAF domain-containing sensor histidine kinase [Chloroflexota bacterium]